MCVTALETVAPARDRGYGRRIVSGQWFEFVKPPTDRIHGLTPAPPPNPPIHQRLGHRGAGGGLLSHGVLHRAAHRRPDHRPHRSQAMAWIQLETKEQRIV